MCGIAHLQAAGRGRLAIARPPARRFVGKALMVGKKKSPANNKGQNATLPEVGPGSVGRAGVGGGGRKRSNIISFKKKLYFYQSYDIQRIYLYI